MAFGSCSQTRLSYRRPEDRISSAVWRTIFVNFDAIQLLINRLAPQSTARSSAPVCYSVGGVCVANRRACLVIKLSARGMGNASLFTVGLEIPFYGMCGRTKECADRSYPCARLTHRSSRCWFARPISARHTSRGKKYQANEKSFHISVVRCERCAELQPYQRCVKVLSILFKSLYYRRELNNVPWAMAKLPQAKLAIFLGGGPRLSLAGC
jgi:hypothetical protein